MFTSSSGNGKIVERVILERQSNPLVILLGGQVASNSHFFGRLTNLTLSAATWSAILYGSYKFYENITKNPGKTDVTMEMIYQQLIEQNTLEEDYILRAKLTELIRTVSTVREFLSKYVGNRDDNLLIIKQELTSIKSLLVGRNQFTDVPKIPKLPAWQTMSTNSNKSPTSLSDISANSSDSSPNQV